MRESIAQRALRLKNERRLERKAVLTNRTVEEVRAEELGLTAEAEENARTSKVAKEVLALLAQQGRIGMGASITPEVEEAISTIFERVGAKVFRAHTGLIAREIAKSLPVSRPAAASEEEKVPAKPEKIRIPFDDIQAIIDHLQKEGSPV
ncbi:MAG: hypothetical protein HYY93_07145 [Planctomycetes bacterium]|nr:hypothetical protein [Planctomycetota bacterium]